MAKIRRSLSDGRWPYHSYMLQEGSGEKVNYRPVSMSGPNIRHNLNTSLCRNYNICEVFKWKSFDLVGSNLAHFENCSFIVKNCFNNRRNKSLVVFNSDKTGYFTLNTKENYVESMKKHVEKDKKVTKKQIDKSKREIMNTQCIL